MTSILKYLNRALLVLLLAAFAACSDNEGGNESNGNGDDGNTETPADGDTYGYIKDTNGNPVEGVVVSDGYSCTATDAEGRYALTRNADAGFVFYSLPSAYKVSVDKTYKLPRFFARLQAGTARYDFTLEALAAPEKRFDLICIGDPQINEASHAVRFKEEAGREIREYAASAGVPCYGITLGDIGWNTENTDYTNDVFPLMKKAMQTDKVGLPLFQVMGNHDNKVIAVSKDNYTVAHDIAAQRNFEYIFGYSFDRGNVHIIAMDNIIFPSHKDYSLGFRDDQVEWLRQDLSYVSKDKMVILCVHIPMRASGNQNVQAVFELLKPFAEVHVMSGHTHYAENNVYDSHYEHVHGAACGAWWNSTINVDGTPNGYAIYNIKGATITDWVYKGTGLDAQQQIRLYRANDIFMRDYSKNYQFYYKGDDQIVANVWNADKDWKIEVYENGIKTGEMTHFDYTGNEKDKSWDAWALGYHIGVVGKAELDSNKKPTSYYQRNVRHLYYYTLQSPTASVEVRATDRFGTTFTQTKFTTGLAEDFPVGE